jgi:hypothetical protein
MSYCAECHEVGTGHLCGGREGDGEKKETESETKYRYVT